MSAARRGAATRALATWMPALLAFAVVVPAKAFLPFGAPLLQSAQRQALSLLQQPGGSLCVSPAPFGACAQRRALIRNRMSPANEGGQSPGSTAGVPDFMKPRVEVEGGEGAEVIVNKVGPAQIAAIQARPQLDPPPPHTHTHRQPPIQNPCCSRLCALK